MISLDLARRLQSAGLRWQPQTNDYFAIPDRDMDEKVFVISDLMSMLARRLGQPAITFHGTAEWALDYIVTREVVWLPREDQLRAALEAQLQEADEIPVLNLGRVRAGYRCAFRWRGQARQIEAEYAAAAYAEALLWIAEKNGGRLPDVSGR